VSAPRGGRALTIIAVGFLLLDALLLAYAGLKTSRLILVGTAAVLGLVAWGVLLLWKRQRARLDEIGQARQALRNEARDLRTLLSQRKGGGASPD
jgi:hypothetical protein